MCHGLLWFNWLKVGFGPLPVGSTKGHTSLMSLNEHWTRLDNGAARAKAPGCQRGSCGSVRRGRGIASNVVKVEGEDPGTPCPLKSVWRHEEGPRDRNDSPNIGSTKTTLHTLSFQCAGL